MDGLSVRPLCPLVRLAVLRFPLLFDISKGDVL